MKNALADRVSSAFTKMIPPLRDDRKLADYMREHVYPIAPVVVDEVANKPLTRLDPVGIDMREEAQLALLSTFRSARHEGLFRALRDDPTINWRIYPQWARC